MDRLMLLVESCYAVQEWLLDNVFSSQPLEEGPSRVHLTKLKFLREQPRISWLHKIAQCGRMLSLI